MANLSRMVPQTLLLLIGLAVAAPAGAAAQVATVPVSDARAFLGEWTLDLDAQGMMLVVELDISDENGNVAAALSQEMTGTVKAEKIAKDGENLVLSYTVDAQGQIMPVVVTLTPEGDGLNANFDVAEGMMVATAKATRK